MLLNISNIGLSDWLFGFLAAMFFLTGIFGIRSIIAMYKIGLSLSTSTTHFETYES